MIFNIILIAIAAVFVLASNRRNARFVFGFMLSLGTIPSSGQDSLSLKLEVSDVGGPHQIDTLDQLSQRVVGADPRAALKYARQGYQLSVDACDELRIVRTGLSVAQAYRHLGLVDSALLMYDAVRPLADSRHYEDETLSILNGYALGFIFKADYDRALYYLFESLNNPSVYNDSLSKSVALTNIGLVYYKLRHYEKALGYYLQSYDYKTQLLVNHDLDVLALNIGLCHAYLQNYSEAMRYIERGIALCGDRCTPARIVGFSFAKGVVYYGCSERKTAARFFEQSYRLAKEQGEVRYQLDNIDFLSKIYLEEGDYRLAMSYLKSGEQLVVEFRSLNLERIKIYSRLYELFQLIGDFRRASDYQRKYIQLKDSVYSEELTENLARIEAGYLERENLAKIAFQQELLALNKVIMSRQNVVQRVSILLVMVFIVTIALFWTNYKQKIRSNALLDRKVDERTHELHISEQRHIKAFQHLVAEKDSQEKKISDGIRRIRALCDLALMDVSDPCGARYITKFKNSVDGLEKSVSIGFKTDSGSGDA